MRLSIGLLALIFVVSVQSGFGQHKEDALPYYDGTTEIEQLSTLVDEEDYESLLIQLENIHLNDSLYVSFLNDKIFALIRLKRYEEGLEVIETALNSDMVDNRINFHINKGVCLKGSDQNKAAITHYQKALKEFPTNYKLNFNLGISYEEEGEFKKAANAYMQTLRYAPLFERAHLRLGNLYVKEGRLGQALLCFNMYLLANPDGQHSFSVLKEANEIVQKEQNTEKTNLIYTPDDEVFEEIDIILTNRIALQEGFEVPSKINIAYTKQNYALLSQLENIEASNGFFAEKYLPFFQWIYDNGHFQDFIYTTTYSIENETYKRIVDKKLDEINAFVPKAYLKWLSIMGQNNPVVLDGKNELVTMEYTKKLVGAIGRLKNGEPTGTWTFYDENGKQTTKGSFNAQGEKEGTWEWYYSTGTIDEKGTFKNGEKHGNYKAFHPNGLLKYEVNYTHDKADGVYTYYNNKGALLKRIIYTEKGSHGPVKEYHNVGKLLKKYEYVFEEGDYVGPFKEYFANGTIAMQVNFSKSEKNGLETKFYPDGSLLSEKKYNNGLYNGVLKEYYANGQLYSEGSAIQGDYSGSWIAYHSNGNIMHEYTYEDGLLQGLYKTYDNDGLLYNTFEYRKGEIRAYTYYDKFGNELIKAKKKNGEFPYKSYEPYGTLTSEGIYDVKGGKTGPWKYYTKNGVISEEVYFDDNLYQGIYKGYHKNGKLKINRSYTSDTVQGYSKQFYHWGTLESHGHYKNGEPQGLWEYFYPDGTIQMINYYHNGKINGVQKNYDVAGQLERVEYYEFGELKKEDYYTPEGTIYEVIDFDTVRDTLTYHHSNGNVQSQYQLVNGVFHGKFKAYDYYESPIAEGQYSNGQREGLWHYYTKGNSLLSSETHYNSGKRHGTSTWYHENNQIETIYDYVFDQAQGEKLDYTNNGTLNITSHFVDNELDGRKVFYSNDGALQLIRFYDKGRFIGYTYLDKDGQEKPIVAVEKETADVVSYFKNGKKAKAYTIDKGLLQGDYNSYYSSGNIEKELVYIDDEFHGTQTYYYPDGQIEHTANYLHGHEYSVFTYYYPNGQLKKEENYKNGTKNGDTTHYNTNGEKIKSEHYAGGYIVKVKTF